MSPITVTLNFASEADLLAFFANKKAVVNAPVEAPAPKAPPVKLTDEQHAAVDDTAGLSGEAGNARGAATARTQPTAKAGADAAPEKMVGASSPAAGSAAAAPQASTAVTDYKVLQQAVFKLAGLSREAALEVNAAFGVKTMKDLDPARWGEALAAVEAKIAELG